MYGVSRLSSGEYRGQSRPAISWDGGKGRRGGAHDRNEHAKISPPVDERHAKQKATLTKGGNRQSSVTAIEEGREERLIWTGWTAAAILY